MAGKLFQQLYVYFGAVVMVLGQQNCLMQVRSVHLRTVISRTNMQM